MEAYCHNCGKECLSHYRFCPACGGDLVVEENTRENESQHRTEYSPPKEKRDIDLTNLRDAFAYFEPKSSSYENLITLYAKRTSIGNGLKGKGIWKFFIMGTTSFLMGCVGSGVFLIIGLTILLIWAILFICRIVEILRAPYNHRINNEQIAYQEKILQQYYAAYNHCPVAFEYSSPAIIMELIQRIQLGRADNIKEAINCMLEDNHKQVMLATQQLTAEAAREAADSASTAAIFSAGTFINTRK